MLKNYLRALIPAGMLLLLTLPAAAQDPVKDIFVKHLKTSRDFTVAVAEAMPDSNYDFKLTPEQKSFGEQLTHLAGALGYFSATLDGTKPSNSKPKAKGKDEIISFVKEQYDAAITKVGGMSHDQFMKSYKVEGENGTGLELVMLMLDHCTHHRASAEMYLRAKGVKPPDYKF